MPHKANLPDFSNEYALSDHPAPDNGMLFAIVMHPSGPYQVRLTTGNRVGVGISEGAKSSSLL